MSDWKDKLKSSELYKEGGGKKTCRICKEPLRDDKFDICYKCSQQNKITPGSLPQEYITKLKEGYFNDKGNLWEDFITTMASKIALSFKGLKNHQLRRFYGHAKSAENRLRMTNDWDAVNIEIKRLEPFVSEAKGKDKIPHSFYEFIEKNIKSIHNQKDFEDGFIRHFEAVVAYFTYHYPKS